MSRLVESTCMYMRDSNLIRLGRALFLLAVSLTVALHTSAQLKKAPALRPITVITEPSAKVWIDGVLYGTTDDKGRIAIASVLPGVRSLRVRANGFAEFTRSLPAATRGDVNVKLVKTTDEAELAFQSAETQTTIDREKAIAEYQRAIKLRPNYPDAYIGLTRAYSERGDIEAAHKTLQGAKRLRAASAEISAVEGRVQSRAPVDVRAV